MYYEWDSYHNAATTRAAGYVKQHVVPLPLSPAFLLRIFFFFKNGRVPEIGGEENGKFFSIVFRQKKNFSKKKIFLKKCKLNEEKMG